MNAQPIWTKEYLFAKTFRVMKNGTIIVCFTSVEHPDCLPKKGYTRASNIFGGFILIPSGENRCRVKNIISIPSGGSIIPALNQKIVVENQSTYLERLRVFAQKTGQAPGNSLTVRDWTHLNGGGNSLIHDWFRFLNKHPVPTESENTETEIIEDPFLLEEKDAFPQEIQSEFEEEYEPVSALSYLTAACISLSTFLIEHYLSLQSESDWKIVNESNGLVQKQIRRSNVLGKSIQVVHVGVHTTTHLNAGPEHIAALVGSLNRRFWIDSWLSKNEELLKIGSNTRIEWMLFDHADHASKPDGGASLISGTKHENSCSVHEAVVIEHRRDLSDGRILLVSKSTTHNLKPKYTSVERLEVVSSGWFLTPVFPTDSRASRSSQVSYMHIIEVDALYANTALKKLIAHQSEIIQKLNHFFP